MTDNANSTVRQDDENADVALENAPSVAPNMPAAPPQQQHGMQLRTPLERQQRMVLQAVIDPNREPAVISRRLALGPVGAFVPFNKNDEATENLLRKDITRGYRHYSQFETEYRYLGVRYHRLRIEIREMEVFDIRYREQMHQWFRPANADALAGRSLLTTEPLHLLASVRNATDQCDYRRAWFLRNRAYCSLFEIAKFLRYIHTVLTLMRTRWQPRMFATGRLQQEISPEEEEDFLDRFFAWLSTLTEARKQMDLGRTLDAIMLDFLEGYPLRVRDAPADVDDADNDANDEIDEEVE
ncbi:uncharacterized protein K452DRAFT_300652 [Aplosporella prunicola CBS 121167]|uniref:Uncharacterized protein n=1 Tax=Aplosporella prunicola CBS 121167 TaxID=1176127 RepID=A0A6A6B4X7_9PEZI|nr:uncharacterized protein K452DRAFT_300652 [Aplosporella prunicola CBS 121167]KAF2139090.1 hypothetical protein K452DRAFT_300652 [Aplosporella prunicola CBS 121167]